MKPAVTLCGVCSKPVLCECKTEQMARQVNEENPHISQDDYNRYYRGIWHNGPTHRPFMQEALEKAAVILPDIIETAIFGREFTADERAKIKEKKK
jgi:hypothetical protein